MNTKPGTFQPTILLNEDGSASMATMLLLSHHAFRRDISRFIRAVAQIKAGDNSRIDALRSEWENSYRQALHGHHTAEDTHIFPDIKLKHPTLAGALDTLTHQHHLIDPLIESGDAAFMDLAHPEQAEAMLNDLKMLLDSHLAFEEAQITPSLREGRDFPVPADEKTVTMYAHGFAWSMQGISSEVVEKVKELLPEILLTKLPQAQGELEARSKAAWGEYGVSSSTTSVPDNY